jgi:hypothetical protein
MRERYEGKIQVKLICNLVTEGVVKIRDLRCVFCALNDVAMIDVDEHLSSRYLFV